MAINPPSDIVLDVARAADPVKLQAAALKLTGAVDDDGSAFTGVVDGLDSSSALDGGFGPMSSIIGLPGGIGAKGAQMSRSPALSGPEMKPYRQFEAFVLQSFIQDMLPKNAEGVFGQGTAGEMWKAMLAEQLGKELAQAGGIGIAAAIYKAHPGGARDLAGKAAKGARTQLAAAAPPAVSTEPPSAQIAAAPVHSGPLDINPEAGVPAPRAQTP